MLILKAKPATHYSTASLICYLNSDLNMGRGYSRAVGPEMVAKVSEDRLSMATTLWGIGLKKGSISNSRVLD